MGVAESTDFGGGKSSDVSAPHHGRPNAKRVILVRHGQSTYNDWRQKSIKRCTCLWENYTGGCDAPLSAKGKQQVQQLREIGFMSDLRKEVQLVVTSPLVRAMETALGAFLEPLSTSGACRPIVALASVAERLDTACDIGTRKSELQQIYKNVDFSQVVDEYWWYGGRENSLEDGLHHEQEPWTACYRRVDQTIQWLRARPETCIAVVGHSSFFQAMTGSCAKMPNCGVMEIDVGEHDEARQQPCVKCCAECWRSQQVRTATDHRRESSSEEESTEVSQSACFNK